MKKLILMLALTAFISLKSNAQFSIGPRFGLSQTYTRVDETIESVKYKTGKAMVGFHAGAFARVKIASVYIQPEVLFSSTGAKIDINDPNNGNKEVLKYHYNRIDVPVMVGLKKSIFRFNLGPVATFNIDSKNKSTEVIKEQIVQNYKSATIGMQAGVGLDLGKVLIDIKYETGLGSSIDSIVIDGQKYNFDQRGSQVLLSVGYNILD